MSIEHSFLREYLANRNNNVSLNLFDNAYNNNNYNNYNNISNGENYLIMEGISPINNNNNNNINNINNNSPEFYELQLKRNRIERRLQQLDLKQRNRELEEGKIGMFYKNKLETRLKVNIN